jgi:hypothetical protein
MVGFVAMFFLLIALGTHFAGRSVSNDAKRLASTEQINLRNLGKGYLEGEVIGPNLTAPSYKEPVAWWRLKTTEYYEETVCDDIGSSRDCREESSSRVLEDRNSEEPIVINIANGEKRVYITIEDPEEVDFDEVYQREEGSFDNGTETVVQALKLGQTVTLQGKAVREDDQVVVTNRDQPGDLIRVGTRDQLVQDGEEGSEVLRVVSIVTLIMGLSMISIAVLLLWRGLNRRSQNSEQTLLQSPGAIQPLEPDDRNSGPFVS